MLNWFDIIVLILLVLYAWSGVVQGLLKQVVGLLGFFIALVLALYGSRVLADTLEPYLPLESLEPTQEVLDFMGADFDVEAGALMVASIFCFIFLFIILQIGFRFLSRGLKMVNRIPILGKLNALGGGGLGLLKGLIFVFILVSVLSLVSVEVIENALTGSEVATVIQTRVSGLFNYLLNLFTNFFY